MHADDSGDASCGLRPPGPLGRATREKLKSLAAGKMGYTTTQVGDMVAASL